MWSDALNSTLYALAFNEVVGGGGFVGSAAGIAVSAGGTYATVAERFCVVRLSAAAVGDSEPGDG
jgi:hypothetical protein